MHKYTIIEHRTNNSTFFRK